MRKQHFKSIAMILTVLCILLSIILIILKISNFRSEELKSDINSKILSEIDYIDTSIIDAMNKLNNISVARYKVYTKSINKPEDENQSSTSNNEQQSSSESNISKQQNSDNPEASSQSEEQNSDKSEVKEEKSNTNQTQMNVSQTIVNNSLTETTNSNINWDAITYIYENLYSIWPTVSYDLREIGVKEEYLNKFNLDLNGIAQSINKKDKNSALVNFYNLYSQMSTYLMAATDDTFILTNYNTKSAVLNAYTLANEDNKWKEMSESISNAKKNFNNMFEIIDEKDNRRPNIEKTYSIINDLENCTVLNDKNIFYMQYKNAIQSLETL